MLNCKLNSWQQSDIMAFMTAPAKKPTRISWKDDMFEEEMVDLVNKQFPIGTNKLKHIIKNIHAKYPVLSEEEITLIVKYSFEAIREFLLLGYTMNFNDFMTKFSILAIYNKIKPGSNRKPWIRLKTQVKTPKEIRKANVQKNT